jgi:hypothetical protein
MTTTLYNLTDEWQRIYDLACDESEDGEISPDFIRAISVTEGEIDDKLDAIGRLVKSMQSLQSAIDEEAKRLAKRSKSLACRVDYLKDYVQSEMERLGWAKRQAGIFKFAITKNSQPSVVVLDLQAVPHEFDKPPKRELILSAIRQAIETGRDVPGVELVQGTHLRVT